MSILSLIKKVCVQDAVYWPPAGNTGYEPSYGHRNRLNVDGMVLLKF